jgi:hypothetical protein
MPTPLENLGSPCVVVRGPLVLRANRKLRSAAAEIDDVSRTSELFARL